MQREYQGYVMPEDTTIDIFDRLWYCSFSRNLTTSALYHQTFGKPSTGFKAQDKLCQDEVVSTMITIDTMVEYHRRGISIEVMNYDDTKKIYECIQKHLNAWKTHLQTSVNLLHNPPVEDLVELDRFANKIYDKAKYLIPKDQIDSVFLTQLQSRFTLNRSSMTNIFEKRPAKDEPEQYPERTELADVFKRSLTGFNRWK